MEERLLTRVAVFVVLQNAQGEVLLQQRGPNGYLGGYWDFPSGHGEFGEDVRTTAIRELNEEVGLVGKPEDLRLIHIEQYFIEENYINFVFALDSWSGTPKVCEPDKCSAVGWFAMDALPEKCVNAVRSVERRGLGKELSYSITDRESYAVIMGEPFRSYRKG